MNVKELAIQDIKDDLRQHSRCFLAFKKNLTPVINSLVKSYSELQEEHALVEPVFKPGDHIVPKVPRRGIESATVLRVDKKNYYLKILCGTAIIPITAQANYKLYKE